MLSSEKVCGWRYEGEQTNWRFLHESTKLRFIKRRLRAVSYTHLGELDEVKRGSLEEQVGIWRRELTPDGLESAYNGKRIDLTDNCSQYGTGFEPGYKCQVPPESGVTELALEIDRPELYQEYLNSSLTEFSKKYAGKCIGICGNIIPVSYTHLTP